MSSDAEEKKAFPEETKVYSILKTWEGKFTEGIGDGLGRGHGSTRRNNEMVEQNCHHLPPRSSYTLPMGQIMARRASRQFGRARRHIICEEVIAYQW